MLLEELLGEVFAAARTDRNARQKDLQTDDQNLEKNLATADERRKGRRGERRRRQRWHVGGESEREGAAERCAVAAE